MNKRALALAAWALLLTTQGLVSVDPAEAQTPFFSIYFNHLDEPIRFGQFYFDIPPWEFGDRPGYRCAWGFLTSGGQPVARVQFDRGKTYTAIQDQFGQETENDFSQCLHPDELEDLETKPKPAGLADTIVDFNLGGSTLDTITFPATSGGDALSWWELEEAEPDHIELELYWGEDVAVIANVTSLSPDLTLSARSTAAPVINSFSPTGGDVGTAVTINGANFVEPSSVEFNGKSAQFDVGSAGEITATVPSGATTGPITVTTSSGTGTSSTDFLVGDGFPSIASFSPSSGKPGTSVTIIGGNFVDVTSVTFNGVLAAYQVTSPQEIISTVPEGASRGPIEVTTGAGSVVSAEEFIVTSGVTHRSKVSLWLSGRLVAKGRVRSLDGTRACIRNRTVVIERRAGGRWTKVGKDKTGWAGFYSKRIKNRSDVYRSRVKAAFLNNRDKCLADVSPRRTYSRK